MGWLGGWVGGVAAKEGEQQWNHRSGAGICPALRPLQPHAVSSGGTPPRVGGWALAGRQGVPLAPAPGPWPTPPYPGLRRSSSPSPSSRFLPLPPPPLCPLMGRLALRDTSATTLRSTQTPTPTLHTAHTACGRACTPAGGWRRRPQPRRPHPSVPDVSACAPTRPTPPARAPCGGRPT